MKNNKPDQIYKNAYIYLITVVEKNSSLYGKKYVGKSNGNDKYYITGGAIVNRIINKYGTGSINKQIIIKQPMTLNQLNELKRYYIKYYKTLKPNGLNLTLGGDGSGTNYNHTIYNFEHKDGRKISCTQYKLKNKYTLDKGSLSRVCSGKVKSIKGWGLVGWIDKPHQGRNKTIHNFEHKDGRKISCTQSKLRVKENLNDGHLSSVCSGNRKSTGGWFIQK